MGAQRREVEGLTFNLWPGAPLFSSANPGRVGWTSMKTDES